MYIYTNAVSSRAFRDRKFQEFKKPLQTQEGLRIGRLGV